MQYPHRLSPLFWRLLTVLFVIAFVRTAWVCEDAFITLRTIDNMLNGYGLVWNVGERVQTYTHPLWMFLIAVFVYVLSDPYFALITASFALLIATLWVVAHTRMKWDAFGLLGVSSLLWSRAFIDYSSSGLENPLTHLLLITFMLAWLRAPEHRKTFWLSILAAALYLNRPDSIVLIAPALAWIFMARRQFSQMLIGLMPAAAWIGFSLLYYGSPVPNTALAKVATGIPISTRLEQAGHYIGWTAANDPMTLVIMAAGSLAGVTHPHLRVFSLGIVAWMFYLGYVGADYMGGRFFSASALLGAMLLAQTATKRTSIALVIALISTSFILQYTLASSGNFQNKSIEETGIADERGFYYQNLGLLPAWKKGNWQTHPWLSDGLIARQQPGIYTRCAIGMSGYTSGPGVYIIDPLALAEPFLARLPSRRHTRVGHYERAFPAGYLASRTQSRNAISNPNLRALYADILRVTQDAELWSVDRLAAIWRLNSDYHAAAKYFYDPEAIGLPGIPIQTENIFSCYGIPNGFDKFYRLDNTPYMPVDVLRKPPILPNRPKSQFAPSNHVYLAP